MIHKRIALIILFLVAVIGLIVLSLYLLGYGINTTKSYPLGIYKKTPINTNETILQKGKLVIFCPKASKTTNIFIERGLWNRGVGCDGYSPLLKAIVGIPNDRINVDYSGVSVNGKIQENSEILAPSFLSTNIPFEITLKANEYWLMSNYNHNSFDSRYFGAVPLKNIVSYAKPIYTP